jgi:hypothetical protein
MMQKSLIDGEFLDEGEEVEKDDDVQVDLKEGDSEVDIEVVDDTPEEDKGKWIANDETDGEPDFPDDEEKKEYGKKVKDRIDKLTARMQAERRAKEQTERQFSESVTAAKAIIEENNRLKELIQSGEKVLVDEHRGRLEAALNTAKAAYREAHEAGDVDGVIAAQEQMSKAVAAMDRVSIHRVEEIPKSDPEAFGREFNKRPQPVADPDALKWREKNDWFMNDDVMTQYALIIHNQLVTKEGMQPKGSEYYKRIDSEMTKRFPEKFKTPRRTRGAAVAGGDRTGAGKSGTRRVTLTETQVALARRLGLSNEQYAKQVLAEREMGDVREYTHTS